MATCLSTLLVVLSLVPCALQAQWSDAEVAAAVAKLEPSLIEIRHDIHEHPELSNREVRTAALVANQLKALGLEVRTGVAKTGVIGILRGGRPGPVVALRADMDALPVTEPTPLPFKSTVRIEYQGRETGVSHACGHDIHVAVALGVARVLAAHKADLTGTVMFVFQPAEEGASGRRRRRVPDDEGARTPTRNPTSSLRCTPTAIRRKRLATGSSWASCRIPPGPNMPPPRHGARRLPVVRLTVHHRILASTRS